MSRRFLVSLIDVFKEFVQNGSCPRTYDYDDLYQQVQWLMILEEVILPLDNMEDNELSTIAPHQHSTIVKNAIMV